MDFVSLESTDFSNHPEKAEIRVACRTLRSGDLRILVGTKNPKRDGTSRFVLLLLNHLTTYLVM